MATTPPRKLDGPDGSNAVAGPSTPPSYPPTPSKPLNGMNYGDRLLAHSNTSPPAPARQVNDYDSDEDADEIEQLVYMPPSTAASKGMRSAISHRSAPSTSVLLGNKSPDTPASPRSMARQRILRSYEDEQAVDSPIRRIRACSSHVTGLIKRNEGAL
jgi:hypothetical protein